MAANLFAPGHFPGVPFDPRKFKRGNIIKPNTYAFDEFNEYLDSLGISIYGLPMVIKKRILDDWTQNLKASIRPEGIKPERLDDFNVDDIPGVVGTAINLNPVDWIKDPGKQLKAIANKSIQDTFNMGDFETRAKIALWDEVVTGEKKYDTSGFLGLGKLRSTIANSFVETIEKRATSLGVPAGTNLLQLSGGIDPITKRALPLLMLEKGDKLYDLDTGTTVTPKVDVGKAIKDAGRQYYNGASSGATIISGANKFLNKGMIFLDAELDSLPADALNPAATRAKEILKHKMNVVGLIGSEKGLGKLITGEGGISDKADAAYHNATDAKLAAAAKAMLKLHDTYTSAPGTNVIDKVAAEVTALDALITASTSPDEKAAYLPLKKQYAKLIDDLKKQRDTLTRGTGVLAEFKALGIDTKLTAVPPIPLTDDEKKKLRSILGRAKDQISDVTDINTRAELLKEISHERALLNDLRSEFRTGGRVLDVQNSVTTAGGVFQSAHVGAHMAIIENDLKFAELQHMFTTVESGNFFEIKFWNDYAKKIRYITPSYWTGVAMKQVQYFGFVIDSSMIELDENGQSKSFFGTILRKAGFIGNDSERPSGLFGNHFNVTLLQENPADPRKPFAVGKVQGLWGGRHFKAVTTLSKLMTSDDYGNWKDRDVWKILLSELEKKAATPTYVITAAGLGARLAAAKKSILFLEEFNDKKGAAALEDFLNQDLTRLHSYLSTFASKKNSLANKALNAWTKGLFGKVVDFDAKDPDQFMAMMRGLFDKNMGMGHPDNLVKITSRYAGFLQKYATVLNRVQTLVQNRLMAKYLMPFFTAKYTIQQQIRTITMQLLTSLLKFLKLGTAGTTGPVGMIVAAVGFFLSQIISKLFGKIWDLAENVLKKGILKGDIFGALDDIAKAAISAANVVIKRVGAFWLAMFFAIFTLNSNIAIATPKIDPTIGNTGFGGNYGSYGGSASGCTDCSVATEVRCFQFIDAPGMTITNGSKQMALMTWPESDKNVLSAAATNAENTVGPYIEKLCKVGDEDAKTISVYRFDKITENGQDVRYCGYVFNDSEIYFGGPCGFYSTQQEYYNYLFVHETGHVYENRHGIPDYEEFTRIGLDEGPLPTYSAAANHCLGSNASINVSEDFAETLGDRVAINQKDCGGVPSPDVFWEKYPQHKIYVDDFMGLN